MGNLLIVNFQSKKLTYKTKNEELTIQTRKEIDMIKYQFGINQLKKHEWINVVDVGIVLKNPKTNKKYIVLSYDISIGMFKGVLLNDFILEKPHKHVIFNWNVDYRVTDYRCDVKKSRYKDSFEFYENWLKSKFNIK